MSTVTSILTQLHNVRKSGDGFTSKCPAHDDDKNSLSICAGSDGRTLLNCHAGCEFKDIVAALGLKLSDLSPKSGREQRPSAGEPEAVYDYHNADGRLTYQVCRMPGKRFAQRRPSSAGGWIWKLEGVMPVLYRLPEVLAAVKRCENIFVVEGEKDCASLARLGLCATTNSGGAGKWREGYADSLEGASVIILPDNDAPGHKHAEQVAKSLHGKASSVRVLELPGLPPKGDVSDWLATGGTREELLRLAGEALEWEPVQEDNREREGLKTEWPEPEPLNETLKPVLKLDPEILPVPFREWVTDVAYRMQAPVDFCAAALLVILGSVVGSGCGVKPKRKDDWLVVPNLWGGVVGRPGTMKTPALAEMLKPLARLEIAAKEVYDYEMTAFEGDKEVHKASKEALRGEMLKAAKSGTAGMGDIRQRYIALQDPAAPVWRRYKSNDATIEKLGELLRDNPNGVLLFRDELVGLLASWDKDGREPDRAFFLEAWNGQGAITSDRIGRGTVHVENACVSILGGIQPAKLLAYLHQATSELENDGLIQRMQLLVYPDESAAKIVDEYPDTAARERAFRVLQTLASMDFREHGAATSQFELIPCYQFDKHAQEIFYQWLEGLNIKIHADEPPVILEHLNKFRSLMPSIALIHHLANVADGQAAGAITADSAAVAVKWCEYLESHMRRIYGMIGDVSQRAAIELAKKLQAGKLSDVFSVRDVYRQCWHLLNTKELVQAACDELAAASWIKESYVPVDGQREKMVYLINPKIPPKGGGARTDNTDSRH